MWPEKRVGLYWEWSYSLFQTFGHLTIEGNGQKKKYKQRSTKHLVPAPLVTSVVLQTYKPGDKS
jgi:hypothetical protein